MRLTTATDLSRFVGGEVETQNQSVEDSGPYLYRGQTKTLRVVGSGDDAILIIEFDWLAKADGFPPNMTGWDGVKPKPYRMPLLIYGVSDIGGGRLCLISPYNGEVTTLFPKGGSALGRHRVRGL